MAILSRGVVRTLQGLITARREPRRARGRARLLRRTGSVSSLGTIIDGIVGVMAMEVVCLDFRGNKLCSKGFRVGRIGLFSSFKEDRAGWIGLFVSHKAIRADRIGQFVAPKADRVGRTGLVGLNMACPADRIGLVASF